MGAAREGFDLFNKNGRRTFWSHLKRGRFNSYVWGDTFSQLWCCRTQCIQCWYSR